MGDGRETLPVMWDTLPRSVALAHIDIGTGDIDGNSHLATEIVRLIAPLMRSNAVVVSDPPCHQPGWSALPLPIGVRAGRYHLYLVR